MTSARGGARADEDESVVEGAAQLLEVEKEVAKVSVEESIIEISKRG